MANTTGMVAAEEIQKLSLSPKRFTREDLQRIRENMHGMSLAAQGKALEARLNVELIDATCMLDVSSTKLMTVANRLTCAILALTVVGLIFSGVQIYFLI